MSTESNKDADRRCLPRLVRPRVGDVWAFGSPTGRPVTIDRIAFGAAGSWGMVGGKLTHISGPRRRLYVHASGAMTQSVASWLQSWCLVSRANDQRQATASAQP